MPDADTVKSYGRGPNKCPLLEEAMLKKGNKFLYTFGCNACFKKYAYTCMIATKWNPKTLNVFSGCRIRVSCLSIHHNGRPCMKQGGPRNLHPRLANRPFWTTGPAMCTFNWVWVGGSRRQHRNGNACVCTCVYICFYIIYTWQIDIYICMYSI